MPTLTSLGGAGTVTGSKHLLESEGGRLLVDCGLFQGLKNLRELNWAPFPVSPGSIDAVILTHAHLDHTGYLPKLVRDGFRGPVYATPATRDVAALILADAAHLQEKDAEYANRKGFSSHKPALPLYTVKDAERALGLFRPVDFDVPFDASLGAELLFRHAGHILGAASVEVTFGGAKVLFSGDIGRYGDPMLPDPVSGMSPDYVVMESTYGDRQHPAIAPVQELGTIVEETVAQGGTVVIPAFAVGRAQSLLYHLWSLRQSGRLREVPVYLDSPMAIDATDLLCAHPSDLKLAAQICRDACGIATYVRDVDGSKALSANRHPKIVISASGMATGGRVLHHLKAFAPDSRNTILFSGFQAVGTRGRDMVQGATEVKIHGEWIPVRARVENLSALSAHADSGELMRWLSGLKSPPRKVFIVHGEPEQSEALRRRIGRDLGWSASVPRQDQRNEL
jgi:metallo-beta-lactamase family protein